MAKKARKDKEPVRIRFKKLANGNQSIYLDFYRNGQRKYEFLKLYLIPNPVVVDVETKENGVQVLKTQNDKTLEAARAIKAQRVLELTNGEAGIRNHHRDIMLLKDYIGECIEDAEVTHRGKSFKTILQAVARQMEQWQGSNYGALRMKNVTPDFCRGFINHLRNTRTTTGKKLSDNSLASYTSALASILKDAAADDIIPSNPMDKLNRHERCRRTNPEKVYLTAGEVSILEDTECDRKEIKDAFLFACYTGLRISDIINLTWKNIREEGGSMRLDIVMKKTGDPLRLALSNGARRHLPERGSQSDKVFNLPGQETINAHISRWSGQAGIGKHITFHTARHTFATLGYIAGADLYTVSKLLGHKSVATTTIYAEMTDSRKNKAVEDLSAYITGKSTNQ